MREQSKNRTGISVGFTADSPQPKTLTPDDISVIRERFHGWEQASAKTLADVFSVSVQRITAIIHSNRPDFNTETPSHG